MIPTNTFILTFDSPTPPTQVKAGYVKLNVRPYVPTPMRCYKCHKFGHGREKCRRQDPDRFLNTSKGVVTHKDLLRCHAADSCKNDPHCVNSRGDHAASDRVCPYCAEEQAILRYRAYNGGTFQQARAAIAPDLSSTVQQGSSGLMEVEAAKIMWQRSVQRYGLRYIDVLSDGEAKTCNALCELQPYGADTRIEKEECINHPLDTSVFRPVKSKWQSLLLKYARTRSGPVSKKHFPEMISKLFDLAFTQGQVKRGFRRTGIFPCNDKAINTPTFSQRPQLAAFATELTPASSSSSAAVQISSVQDLDTPSCSMAASSSSSEINLPSLSSVSRPSTPPDSRMSPSPSASASSSRPSTPPSGNSSIKDYFLKQLQPRFAQASGRGRSARVMRFRYGESLAGEECLQRLREEADKKKTVADSRS
ncbi:nucleic-acid-binding protein from mobile element jockey [Elysia marginata]|uniref:Nucleic-acid-binding protein from mobile element jockey n=1 Tax=Elysia marginata TaxID=1093978 RepID=A0AAV4JKM7_9GAST|nr:nucleic-acid-binding protein from mobile element jockey [Elysia marginata]